MTQKTHFDVAELAACQRFDQILDQAGSPMVVVNRPITEDLEQDFQKETDSTAQTTSDALRWWRSCSQTL